MSLSKCSRDTVSDSSSDDLEILLSGIKRKRVRRRILSSFRRTPPSVHRTQVNCKPTVTNVSS